MSIRKVTPPHAEAMDSNPQYSLWQLVAYALRLGTFGCGSPIALVGYMHRDLERQLIGAVAMAMITRGPVVISASFIGYLIAPLPGATAAALATLALIVLGADTAKLDLVPQTPGLAAISLGLSRSFSDDYEMLKHGIFRYDAHYTWCKQGQDEVHTWNPTH